MSSTTSLPSQTSSLLMWPSRTQVWRTSSRVGTATTLWSKARMLAFAKTAALAIIRCYLAKIAWRGAIDVIYMASIRRFQGAWPIILRLWSFVALSVTLMISVRKSVFIQLSNYNNILSKIVSIWSSTTTKRMRRESLVRLLFIPSVILAPTLCSRDTCVVRCN